MPSLSPRCLPALLLPALLLTACEREPEALDPHRFPLIPLPAGADAKKGEMELTSETRIVLDARGNPELAAVVDRWAARIRAASGLPLPVTGPEEVGGRGHLRVALAAEDDEDTEAVPPGRGLPGTRAESYELEVGREGIELEGGGLPGIYYGLNTLTQLIPGMNGSGDPEAVAARVEAAGLGSAWSVPAVEIEDEPRFAYRGMHLDVGRHVFPVSFIKRYIDLLAAYRMNIFHWHLTEDQGWRLEIEKYPRLTEVGSCRAETMVEKNFRPYVGDGVEYCGFYTREEAREIVEYAAERFITVMPEIEMPGHSVAALAAYPELACTEGPFEVATVWGVTPDIYCPGEETFAFLEDVLTEVMEIFPSRLVHIGGDEAPKLRWEESELAQEVIGREGLADEEELQSWFIRRIESFLNENGRSLVGWDEILEGGLAPNATVMSWRGEAGGIAAARESHDIIMTPNSHVYLDHYQGDTIQEPLAIGGFSPMEKVYAYEPVPEALDGPEARHVLGAQGNVWTEYMKTGDHVEYMVLPRILALSEVVWSPPALKDWEHFTRRLPGHLGRLDGMGYNLRVPDVLGLGRDRLTLNMDMEIEMFAPVEGGTVLYTTDGSDPGPGSHPLDHRLILPMDEIGWEIAARIGLPDGRLGAIRRARFARTTLARPVSLPWSERAPGLAVRLVEGRFRSVDGVAEAAGTDAGGRTAADGASPGTSGGGISVPRAILPERIPSRPFGLLLDGFLRVPRSGIYTFHLSSDDGSRLLVAHRLVVDHDGPHSMSEASGEVALHRGWHPVRILYFQAGGAAGLGLEVEGPDLPRRDVPAGWVAHRETDGS